MHAFRFFLLFLKHILYIQTGRGGMLLNGRWTGKRSAGEVDMRPSEANPSGLVNTIR